MRISLALVLLAAACGSSSKPPPAAPAPEPAAPAPAPGADSEAPGGDAPGGAGGEAPLVFDMPPVEPAGGDCEAVSTRLSLVVWAMFEAQLATMPADEAELSRRNMPKRPEDLQQQFAADCVQQAWSVELRDCILTAPTQDELEACEKYAPPAR